MTPTDDDPADGVPTLGTPPTGYPSLDTIAREAAEAVRARRRRALGAWLVAITLTVLGGASVGAGLAYAEHRLAGGDDACVIVELPQLEDGDR